MEGYGSNGDERKVTRRGGGGGGGQHEKKSDKIQKTWYRKM